MIILERFKVAYLNDFTNERKFLDKDYMNLREAILASHDYGRSHSCVTFVIAITYTIVDTFRPEV